MQSAAQGLGIAHGGVLPAAADDPSGRRAVSCPS